MRKVQQTSNNWIKEHSLQPIKWSFEPDRNIGPSIRIVTLLLRSRIVTCCFTRLILNLVYRHRRVTHVYPFCAIHLKPLVVKTQHVPFGQKFLVKNIFHRAKISRITRINSQKLNTEKTKLLKYYPLCVILHKHVENIYRNSKKNDPHLNYLNIVNKL